jgi:hypothetical protein
MSPSPLQLSPARFVGFVLIGVAVVAVGLGVFALVSNGSGTPSASGTPTPPPNTATGLTGGGASSTTTPTPSPTTTAAPSTSSPAAATSIAPPPPAAPTSQAPPVPVQVYNNSLIQGLAKRGAQEFSQAGFDVTIVGSYAQSNLPTTTAFYTTPAEQQVANQLAARFHIQVQHAGPAFATYPPGVIVILTKEFN